ncbi:hypothetical protein DERP_008550 [Dermatophagoides pteronyssinus]|uniref:Uncharacterized protein n=1 Tax=Dermatophagoides pteronyssinus TaxID=6956 RepID=A0ABQ8IWM8_DERPT|nr:hypothetical protein DERP_008550 [Dermatophagoides pteronyssinus]
MIIFSITIKLKSNSSMQKTIITITSSFDHLIETVLIDTIDLMEFLHFRSPLSCTFIPSSSLSLDSSKNIE